MQEGIHFGFIVGFYFMPFGDVVFLNLCNDFSKHRYQWRGRKQETVLTAVDML